MTQAQVGSTARVQHTQRTLRNASRGSNSSKRQRSGMRACRHARVPSSPSSPRPDRPGLTSERLTLCLRGRPLPGPPQLLQENAAIHHLPNYPYHFTETRPGRSPTLSVPLCPLQTRDLRPGSAGHAESQRRWRHSRSVAPRLRSLPNCEVTLPVTGTLSTYRRSVEASRALQFHTHGEG